jgi:hypothetical protein
VVIKIPALWFSANIWRQPGIILEKEASLNRHAIASNQRERIKAKKRAGLPVPYFQALKNPSGRRGLVEGTKLNF